MVLTCFAPPFLALWRPCYFILLFYIVPLYRKRKHGTSALPGCGSGFQLLISRLASGFIPAPHGAAGAGWIKKCAPRRQIACRGA